MKLPAFTSRERAGEHTHKYGAQISVSAGPLRWRLFARRGDEGERLGFHTAHTHEGGVRLLAAAAADGERIGISDG